MGSISSNYFLWMLFVLLFALWIQDKHAIQVFAAFNHSYNTSAEYIYFINHVTLYHAFFDSLLTFIAKNTFLIIAPWNRFQGGASFVDHLYDLCLVFMCVCLLMHCGHLLGKGWPLGSRLWCLIVMLSLSFLYTGSGVVLDCIDSWLLPSFLLL